MLIAARGITERAPARCGRDRDLRVRCWHAILEQDEVARGVTPTTRSSAGGWRTSRSPPVAIRAVWHRLERSLRVRAIDSAHAQATLRGGIPAVIGASDS